MLPALLTLLALSAGAAAPPASDAAAMLAKLRSLSGDWTGTLAWSGARNDTGTINATYSVTGKGSAVIETLISDGEPVMTSVYHLDGADLRVTHFCGAQNQPRLKANRIDVASGAADFAFVDITNLVSPKAGHVAGLELRLPNPDHVTIVFLFLAGAQRSTERIELKRARLKTS